MQFSDFNINSSLLNALSDLNISTPTTIQEKAFPVIMSGRDVVGIAQTGTGKTISYLLPCLRQWKFTKEKHPTILVVVPTRELVLQVVEDVEKLAKFRAARVWTKSFLWHCRPATMVRPAARRRLISAM